jgi:hypothetical protein
MSEATLIFPHMRGGCATVGTTVHALFRVNGRRPGPRAINNPDAAQRNRTEREQGTPSANGSQAETQGPAPKHRAF